MNNRKVLTGEKWKRNSTPTPNGIKGGVSFFPQGTIITITREAREGHSSRCYKVDGEEFEREAPYFFIEDFYEIVK